MPAGPAETELPGAVTLRTGESCELVLPGLGTAGYRWSDAVDGDPDVVALAWSRGFAAGDERRPVGASAPERLVITALSPGRVRVQLIQRRPWESGPPRAEHVIEVDVLP